MILSLKSKDSVTLFFSRTCHFNILECTNECNLVDKKTLMNYLYQTSQSRIHVQYDHLAEKKKKVSNKWLKDFKILLTMHHWNEHFSTFFLIIKKWRIWAPRIGTTILNNLPSIFCINSNTIINIYIPRKFYKAIGSLLCLKMKSSIDC